MDESDNKSDHESNEQVLCLQNHFLIAMPALDDGYFSDTVTYICEHNEDGAMGFVINKPMGLSFDELMDALDIDATDDQIATCNEPVLSGGPVQPQQGFVLHNGGERWENTLVLPNDLYLTSSVSILKDISNGKGPDKSCVLLGYAGWSPNQLEDEIAQNAWLTVAASTDMIFDIPIDERSSAAMKKLGIDAASLSSLSGHA